MMLQGFAQATNLPENGASSAEDFQPLTRNPQTAGGGLQSATGAQSASGQDVLTQKDAHIVVPASNNQPSVTQAVSPKGAGINWLFVVAISVLLVVLLEFVFRRRERRRALNRQTQEEDAKTLVQIEDSSEQ